MIPRLEAIALRIKNATPGPWEFERVSFDGGDFAYERNDDNGMIQIYEHNFEEPMRAKFDAELIAHAPGDLKYLLELVAELKEKADRYDDLCK